jgi:hypothetical protein
MVDSKVVDGVGTVEQHVEVGEHAGTLEEVDGQREEANAESHFA